MVASDETTVRTALAAARRRLTAAGVTTAALDADLLLAHVLTVRREKLRADPEGTLSVAQRRRFGRLIARRADHVPVAYLTGVKEFYGQLLHVTPRVLIPRPETELLVELAISFLQTRAWAREVIDLGTGSGAIAIAIAAAVPRVRVLAADRDQAALRVAAANVRAHRLARRVRLQKTDLLAGVQPADLIVANLPYLSASRRRALPPDVRYEPVAALDGGPDGLGLIRRALRQAPAVLKPGGCIIVECDPAQAVRLRAIAASSWRNAAADIHKDLAGLARAIRVTLPL